MTIFNSYVKLPEGKPFKAWNDDPTWRPLEQKMAGTSGSKVAAIHPSFKVGSTVEIDPAESLSAIETPLKVVSPSAIYHIISLHIYTYLYIYIYI